MASKEANVFVIDLGATMGETNNGRNETDLDYGMRYVYHKITGMMLLNRTTLSVGVVGFRTDDTKHSLDDDEYQNIAVLKELGPMQMPHLQELQRKIHPNNTTNGDAVSAVVVAIEMINEFTTLKTGKPGKFARKIYLLTDGQGLIDGDNEQITQIANKLDESDIELVVIGIDFDDLDFGFKEEDKTPHKAENEKILKDLTDQCANGLFATAAEAVAHLYTPEPKVTKPYSTFKGQLRLGDQVQFPETAIVIDVERYFRTHIASAPSASSFAVRSGLDGSASQRSPKATQENTEMSDAPPGEGNLTAISSSRFYQVDDPDNPLEKKTVEKDDLARGYEYGRTVVPFSSSDENITKLTTKESLEIIGFIPNDKYEKFLNIGSTCITVASKINEKASMALSSFIHALFELDSYAIARFVSKDDKEPQILLLAPFITPDLEALIDVPLPFAEDVRIYRFPPLDRVITTEGKTLTSSHRYLPGNELEDAMSRYVDSMDLSSFGKDDEGNPVEYMAIEDTYSPHIHRINQAIRRRAVRPEEPVGPPAEVLIKYSHPPEELVNKSRSKLNHLIKVAELQRVPPKAKGKRGRETIQPLSNLDIDAILSHRPKRKKITREEAIPGFKQMIEDPNDPSVVTEAATQMTEIIRELLKEGVSKYDQVIENINAMRKSLTEFEEAEQYNDMLKDLKRDLLTGKLGNGGENFFYKLKGFQLGLIEADSSGGGVSAEEAKEFWSNGSDTALPDRSRA